MTVHYHGTPITPWKVMHALAGRSFCVSFARPDQVEWCFDHGQMVMLDNGAFSAWRRGHVPDWLEYYRWCERWLAFWCAWAVIPDVIDGSEADNDALVTAWPHGPRGAPVWHLHESLERLERLCASWPRVCFGSSGGFAEVGSSRWHWRVREAFNRLCPNGGPPPTAIHMLRGMQCSEWGYPFASVDSTDIARNHASRFGDGEGRAAMVRQMADRWDTKQCPAVWTPHQATQQPLFGGDDADSRS